jgi:hypothetical protein
MLHGVSDLPEKTDILPQVKGGLEMSTLQQIPPGSTPVPPHLARPRLTFRS